MQCIAKLDELTGRIRRVMLKSETFEEQRVLNMIVEGLLGEGMLFELSQDGEPRGSFMFNNGREVQ